jgi:hypothetical protein
MHDAEDFSTHAVSDGRWRWSDTSVEFLGRRADKSGHDRFHLYLKEGAMVQSCFSVGDNHTLLCTACRLSNPQAGKREPRWDESGPWEFLGRRADNACLLAATFLAYI